MTRALSRRRFLQVSGFAGATTLLPVTAWDRLLADAAPLPTGAPIVVSLFLGGGLDGAHLLVPIGDSYGDYRDARRELAIDAGDTLDLGDGESALHPAMTNLHRRFGQSDVGFVRGLDLLSPSGFDPLSHFDKTDFVMMGRSAPRGAPSGVWARFADALPENPMTLATVGFGLPLLFGGEARPQATALPAWLGDALGVDPPDEERAFLRALRDIGNAHPNEDSSLVAQLARSGRDAPRTAASLAGAYPVERDESEISRNLRVIASLINANISGTQVYGTIHGGYDTHENQSYTLDEVLLPQLDDAIEAFFTTLADPARVVLMVWSEFGRRPEANGSGTDHGRAGNVVLIGDPIAGGLYGNQPPFAEEQLDDDGNLVGEIDFGAVYADLLGFLDADADTILEVHHDPLGIVN